MEDAPTVEAATIPKKTDTRTVSYSRYVSSTSRRELHTVRGFHEARTTPTIIRNPQRISCLQPKHIGYVRQYAQLRWHHLPRIIIPEEIITRFLIVPTLNLDQAEITIVLPGFLKSWQHQLYLQGPGRPSGEENR